ncbi:MAG: sn-glycerol-3-phosphate ABC transporter ATP-binding protein UgpC [Alphaproteobacteria bacterium]|nr:sn-glycerol-3-phosphate ABC transporter ATP-binding protein UgpC [Alphaproteobacteria bacterium]
MAEVELRQVEKRWGSLTAVRDLTLTIRDREFLVLLGPSGCGKTTTMRMIAGLEPVTSGEILIDGVQVNDRPARDRDISMVFQNYGLYPHLNVRENIGYPLRLRKVGEPERSNRIADAARKVHLEDYLERRPRELSGGQRQRVALARAIVRTPNLFLMDEPLSNLDAILRVSMRAELKHLHHELETTTVYVTHDQIEAMTLATRVVVMNKGEVAQIGTPEEIYGDPETLFVATFIGSPPMNCIRGTLSGGIFENADAKISKLQEAISGDVILGVRPEHVSIAPAEGADITGTVFAVEYTGSGLLVVVQVGNAMVTAMGNPDIRPKFNDHIGLTIDRAGIFFFDADSEKRRRA